jgi:hypothetical protein
MVDVNALHIIDDEQSRKGDIEDGNEVNYADGQ